MEKSKTLNGLQPMSKRCRLLTPVIWALCLLFLSANAFAQEVPESPEPILISASDSTRALAVYPATWRGSLPRKNSEVFNPGERVVLFATNIDLMPGEGANAFRIFAEDARQKQFRFVVEDIQEVKKQNWIYAITVRLYDENEYNGQPAADGDVLVRLSWRGNTSNRVRLGLGTTGGEIKDDPGAAPTPAPSAPPATSDFADTGADRARFMQQAAFGVTPALERRLRQVGIRRWIEEQFTRQPTFAYPDLPLKNVNDTSLGCPRDPNVPTGQTDPAQQACIRDHYSQFKNQNWMFQEALYGDDQLRRRVSWALHQIWVVSGNDTQQQRHLQEYYEILDRHAFGNYRNLMKEMTLNPAMGNYLDMIRSTRSNPNENYPREILQLFTIGLEMLNQDGTPITDAQGNHIPTYDQNTINNYTKVFTGWRECNAAPPTCANNPGGGAANYIDPMMLVSSNHDLTAKTLLNYTQVNGSPAPNPTIAACANCTTDALRIPYANDSLDKTLDNIFYHPNVGPFIGKLLIQHLVTSDPSPAYVARVAAAFNNNGQGERGDMKAVIRAILLDREARGTRKTDPNFGKLREPFQLLTNFLRRFNVRASGNVTISGAPTPPPASCQNMSDGVINNLSNNMAQNVWYPPTVFNYFPPDYVVPGTDVVGPEFGITNTGTSFARINSLNTLVFGQINFQQATTTNPFPNAPCGTSIDLTEEQAWSTADPTANALIEGLNNKMMYGTMSQQMKDQIRNAIIGPNAQTPIIPANNPLARARQAVYLVATSSQYQVQR